MVLVMSATTEDASDGERFMGHGDEHLESLSQLFCVEDVCQLRQRVGSRRIVRSAERRNRSEKRTTNSMIS